METSQLWGHKGHRCLCTFSKPTYHSRLLAPPWKDGGCLFLVPQNMQKVSNNLCFSSLFAVGCTQRAKHLAKLVLMADWMVSIGSVFTGYSVFAHPILLDVFLSFLLGGPSWCNCPHFAGSVLVIRDALCTSCAWGKSWGCPRTVTCGQEEMGTELLGTTCSTALSNSCHGTSSCSTVHSNETAPLLHKQFDLTFWEQNEY